jgi:omega-6 fatty acid desaturase (delta-12 desaturase)
MGDALLTEPKTQEAEATCAADARGLKQVLATHRGSRLASSLFQLVTTTFLFFAGWAAMWWALDVGYWLSLLIAIPTSGMLVRLFILQHDCGHGALFASQRTNQIVGVLLSGATLTPYQCWRRQHAAHHATNGQLDHRGMGDVTMHTLEEYRALTAWQRWQYRLYRHPLILFGIGPILYFGVLQRWPWRVPASWKRERMSIHGANLLLLGIFALAAWAIGPWTFLMLHLPVTALAASAGSWLFFVQHQFNPSYWERDGAWDYHRAAIEGSSFLDLPRPLHWLTANIGYHHIHHLDSRIPNYALPACYESHADLRTAERLTLADGIRCMGLKLWDENTQELITFRQAKRRLRQTQPLEKSTTT